MPAQLLVFYITCLFVVAFARQITNKVFKLPHVFFFLALGILLGVLSRNNVSNQAFELLTDSHTLHVIDFLGWLGCLLLLALGTQDQPDTSCDRHKQKQFIFISLMGFGGTLAIGSLLGSLIGEWQPQLRGSNSTLLAFSLAIGLSCAVTALPVLVSLLHDHRQENTLIGRLAIRVAILDDCLLWATLTAILGMIKTDGGFWLHSLKVALLVTTARFVLRPVLEFFAAPGWRLGLNGDLVLAISAIVFMRLMSEHLGSHALFGAILAGWSMPARLLGTLRTSILPFANILLVPFFFVSTGMQTDLTAFHFDFFTVSLIFTLMGIGLKFIFVSVAARSQGFAQTDAFRLGALLQCKGLMEIVVLGLLRDAQVIGIQAYSALVMMALVCTLFTVPLLNLINWLSVKQSGTEGLQSK